MKVSDKIECTDFPCSDVDKRGYVVPWTEIDPGRIRVIMITEAPPNEKADYFYSAGNPFYLETLVEAFKDAGNDASSMGDILNLGVYVTTAIKCGKTRYAISQETMKNCSRLLEREVALFPTIKVFMLMGDVAIRMMNDIWRTQMGSKVIPAGPTYKIRGREYYQGNRRVFPSYTPAGKNFLIEKSKRSMVADDIREALRWVTS
jgi:uracil-DNA glycosylase